VRVLRTTLIGAVALASITAACSAVAHMGTLQPPSNANYRPAKPSAPAYRLIARPRIELGIDVDFYTYPGQDIAAAAKLSAEYAKSLGANAMSVTFPFFASGIRSSGVHGTSATPSPEELALVASIAEKAGLYFSLRPLLDSSSIGGLSRTLWKPPRLRFWFSSYEHFLLPYAQMARAARIPEFITGAEFSLFEASHYWAGLDAALRRVYSGTLAYANNWGDQAPQSLPSIREMVDAYHPVPVPDTASVSELAAGWRTYDETLPPRTVLAEVDIASQPGAYYKPYVVSWPGEPLVPSIQSKWFTAACDALRSVGLGGIYFWATGLGQPLNAPPSAANPGSFVGGMGAVAIARCFRKLGGTSR
jgi:hypothetical protein